MKSDWIVHTVSRFTPKSNSIETMMLYLPYFLSENASPLVILSDLIQLKRTQMMAKNLTVQI